MGVKDSNLIRWYINSLKHLKVSHHVTCILSMDIFCEWKQWFFFQNPCHDEQNILC
jgi:hypothetical protein